MLDREIGKSWLASAKIARKANQSQTAYSAFLQAQQREALYAFVEKAKLVKKSKEGADNPLLPIDELERSIKQTGLFEQNVIDLTTDPEAERMKAKVCGHLASELGELTLFLLRSSCCKLDGCMNVTGLTIRPSTMFSVKRQCYKRGLP